MAHRKALALSLSLLLAGSAPIPARASSPGEAALRERASERCRREPASPFFLPPGELPAGFRSYLEKTHAWRSGFWEPIGHGPVLDWRGVLEVLDAYERLRSEAERGLLRPTREEVERMIQALPETVAVRPRDLELRLDPADFVALPKAAAEGIWDRDAWEKGLPSIYDGGVLADGGAFARSHPDAVYYHGGPAEPRPPKVRINLGWAGSFLDPLLPYASKDSETEPEWEIKLKHGLDSIGWKAEYRDPASGVGSGFDFQHWGLQEKMGILSVRDDLYGWVGKDKPERRRGTSVGMSLHNAYLGSHFVMEEKERAAPGGEEGVFSKNTVLDLAFNPFGTNPGKPWNVTALLSGSYQEWEHKIGSWREFREGFGWGAGLAFQRSLGDLFPVEGAGFFSKWVRPERFKWEAHFGDGIFGSSFKTSAELSVDIAKHLRGKVELVYRRFFDEDRDAFDINFGIDIRL